jgi:8-oxo-dGTP pyrophosphatase MutT (NUDIX family)
MQTLPSLSRSRSIGVIRLPGVPGTDAYQRRSARVILLDSSHRVLLLKFFFDSADLRQGHGWVTPGGGVDDGEQLQETASRELREEIGLLVSPDALGQPVAYSSGYADLGWARGLFGDDFFLYRLDTHPGRHERHGNP